MATFFDTSVQTDLNLLHSDVREHDEVDNVIDKVEWEILNHYKQRPSIPIRVRTGSENLKIGPESSDIEVQLIGYDSDTPADSDDGLKEALKRAIAHVASWVLRNYDNAQGVSSITQGKRSITYAGTVPDINDWPDGWGATLKNYDDREALYSI